MKISRLVKFFAILGLIVALPLAVVIYLFDPYVVIAFIRDLFKKQEDEYIRVD